MGEMSRIAYENLDDLKPGDMAAFWTEAWRLLQRQTDENDDNNNNSRFLDENNPHLAHHLDAVLALTAEIIEGFSPKHTVQTTLALAKIASRVENCGEEPLHEGGPARILRAALIGADGERKRFLFRHIAAAAMPKLRKFDSRALSNFVYAYGLAAVPVLEFEDGTTLFDVLADAAIPDLGNFNSQDFSNTLWTYANAKASSPRLFKEAADVIVLANEDLNSFTAQALSNIVWAFATAGESHSKLFEKVAEHVIAQDSLGEFSSEDLSNIVWAYASAGESHPKLFEKVANHIIALDGLEMFKAEDISNIVWAYETVDESYPELLKKLEDHGSTAPGNMVSKTIEDGSTVLQ